MTILLVEQNASRALSIGHDGDVMETGRIVMEDPEGPVGEARDGIPVIGKLCAVGKDVWLDRVFVDGIEDGAKEALGGSDAVGRLETLSDGP